MKFSILAAFFIASPLLAQSTGVAATPPNLSATTAIAVNALREKGQAINQEVKQFNDYVAAVDQDIRKAHPGWKLDTQTLQIVKDTPQVESSKAQPSPKDSTKK